MEHNWSPLEFQLPDGIRVIIFTDSGKLEHGIFICGDKFTHRVTRSVQGNTKPDSFVPFRQIRAIVFTNSGEARAWYIYLW